MSTSSANIHNSQGLPGDGMTSTTTTAGQAGPRETAAKESKMDPRSASAREFKPQQYTDGPPSNGVINFLSSECVSVTDLNWWTSDKHILDMAHQAGVQLDLRDIVFAEHKVNGKSKGSVTINCRSPERASMLMHWLHCNDFQGKKIHPTYVTNGSIARPAGYNNQRPSANVPGAAPFATNAHGGINFNRLRPVNRPPMPQAVIQQNYLGVGRPPKGLFQKIESGQLGIQDGMQYGDWPRQTAPGWPGPHSHHPAYASVDVDHPGIHLHATQVGGLPYGEELSFR